MKKLRLLGIELRDIKAGNKTLKWFSYARCSSLAYGQGPASFSSIYHLHSMLPPSTSFSHTCLLILPQKYQIGSCLRTLVVLLCLSLQCSFLRFHVFYMAQSLYTSSLLLSPNPLSASAKHQTDLP